MAVERLLIEKNVPIELRDGVRTYGDVFRPAEGPATPALITRLPYDKELFSSPAVAIMPAALKLAERGYAVVIADCRGRYSSEGEFTPFMNEGRDGYDTIEWAAAQPWCDGQTAIFGPSYIGATTLLAARERPPSLRCAVPIITSDDYYDGWTYQGGAYQLGFATLWGMGLAATAYLRSQHALPEGGQKPINEALFDPAPALATRPLTAIPGISAPGVAPWWSDWLTHDSRNDYWEAARPSRDYSDFDVPMLHVGGWFDIFGIGTVRNFQGMGAAGRASQQLIMGPWSHAYYDRYLGELDFGPTGAVAMSGVVEAYNRFFDCHLKGRNWDSPDVRYFVMGANEWREADAWPPPETQLQRLYLHSNGAANSARGDGVLSQSAPSGSERPDRYLYDPARPVPSEGGPTLHSQIGLPGPRDQRAVETRDDVLCYSTEALPAPLIVAGPVFVELHAVTDAPDTDWTAKLVDVHPDGKAVSLCDGILRARFRHSLAEAVPLKPGTPGRYRIDLASIAHRFAPGHRVRLEISSSNFPRFDPNPNTGGPTAAETLMRPALQQVLHDAEHPSFLEVYVLPE